MQCLHSSSSTFTFSMKQLVITLAILGTAIAARLDHLESQYLPPTGRTAGASQYSGTPSTQFAGLNTFPGSSTTQDKQPIAFGATASGYQRQGAPIGFGTTNAGYQKGQYYSGIQDGRYGGARGQYATQYSGAATVRAENQPNGGDGIYSYSFETSNGISAQESAIRKSIEINKAEAASGRYQEGQYQQQGYDASAQQYGSTAGGQFRQQYVTPGQQYNSPNQQYGAPGVRDNLGFAVQQQYGVPLQQQQFGNAQQQYKTPVQQYGTPAIGNQFPAPFQQHSRTPAQQYGAPSQQYGAPSQQYDASRQSQSGIGRQYSQQVGQQYVAPSSRGSFGPRQSFGAPAPQYGTPTGPLRTEDSNQGYRY
nr:unnamed protein product [Callosobruchus chinensis]